MSDLIAFEITDSVHADTMNTKVVTPGNSKLDKAGGTLTGDLDFDGNKAVGSQIEDYVETLDTTTGTGAIELDLTDGNVFEVTINADTATTISVDPLTIRAGAHSFTLILHQHADGPAITLDFDDGSSGGDILWAGDSIPEVPDDETIVYTFFTLDEGATWYGHEVGQNYGEGI